MAGPKSLLTVILFFAAAGIGTTVFSQQDFKTDADEARAYNVTRTIKTVEGLKFSVQSDRPIEKVAGVYRPLDIDAYVAMKFSEADKKIAELSQGTARQFDQVSAHLNTLSKKIDILAQKVQDLEKKQEDFSAKDERKPAAREAAPEGPASGE